MPGSLTARLSLHEVLADGCPVIEHGSSGPPSLACR
jgi:hypothetical protein